MSAMFVVERNGPKPVFTLDQLKESTRSSEVATFDLTISVRGKTVVQIYGARLVNGREGRFVAGPSFPGVNSNWVNVVMVSRDLQPDLVRQVEQQLEEQRNGS
jgi:hypothetical protein